MSSKNNRGGLTAFLDSLPHPADPFQTAALEAVERGASVVVAAPTGAGKTLVAEGAVEMCLGRGGRAFYTTPIKALSNQKFRDLCGIYGSERVGLLTGDNTVNGGAPVVVMTTEVLRNMIYVGDDLSEVEAVVLDEVHYLQDRARGAVWEEVIIHAPPHIRLVCLSATVANAGEFTDWVRSRRGPTELVVEEHRPVPLERWWSVRDLYQKETHLLSLFSEREDGRGEAVNPDISRLLARRRRGRRRMVAPRRSEIVEMLEEEGMLPAIYFVFSRAGCEESALRLVDSGVRLADSEERGEIRRRAEEGTSHLRDADLRALSYDRWVWCLEAGVAAHHAGLVPAFKEVVEELFSAGLIRVVFATETLALGINMPARTVVLDRLTKYTGEGHEALTPGEFTQLTGRAGRRGIDEVGHGVVLHSPHIPLEQMAGIAAWGSHPLRSSFRPTYNMVVNLMANYDRRRSERLLRASFAQFQMDRRGGRGRRRGGRDGLVRHFHRARELLAEMGYASDWSLTGRGEALRVIYNELDLLLLEAAAEGLLAGLSGPELAALVSCFVFEPRRETSSPDRLPTTDLDDRWERLLVLRAGLAEAEEDAGLEATRPPEAGFTHLAYHWAGYAELDDLLEEDALAPGDFVRTVRQVEDVLRQLRDAAPLLEAAGDVRGLAEAAGEALRRVDRGVVAARGVM